MASQPQTSTDPIGSNDSKSFGVRRERDAESSSHSKRAKLTDDDGNSSSEGSSHATAVTPSNQSASASAATRTITSLATIEIRLVMQFLDIPSLVKLARCSHLLHDAADHPFTWQHTSSIRVEVKTDADVVPLASGVSRHAPLIVFAERVDLSPLIARRVTRFTYTFELTDVDIDVVRQMRWLVSFDSFGIPGWKPVIDRRQFDRLLAPGHQLVKLQQLPLSHVSIDDANAIHLLADLPSLVTLAAQRINLNDWSQLTQLSSLTHVEINAPFKHDAPADRQAFYMALMSLQQLQVCRISMDMPPNFYIHPPVATIPPLPRLRQLSLWKHRINSFAFLSTLPLLERLCLCRCVGYNDDAIFATFIANWPPNLNTLLLSGAEAPISTAQRHMITARIRCEPSIGNFQDSWPPRIMLF